MSTSTFGGDMRLINQVLMLASKFGDPEQLLKILAGNQEVLAYILDLATFNFSSSHRVNDEDGNAVEMRFVCFSENSFVHNDEVNGRVERFGRYATSQELEQIFKRFKDTEDRFKFNYPIITHSIESGCLAERYEYTQIGWGGFWSKMEFCRVAVGGESYKKSGMIWNPATMFAVVSHEGQKWDVLSSRKKLPKLPD